MDLTSGNCTFSCKNLSLFCKQSMHVTSVNWHAVPEHSKLTYEAYLERHSLMCRANDQALAFEELGVKISWSLRLSIGADVNFFVNNIIKFCVFYTTTCCLMPKPSLASCTSHKNDPKEFYKVTDFKSKLKESTNIGSGIHICRYPDFRYRNLY